MNQLSVMTDEQLLSMIIPASGAASLLQEYNTLNGVFNNVSEQQFDLIKGIGETKKRLILCVKEIMRRIEDKTRRDIRQFDSPDAVYEYFKFLQDRKQEEVWVLLLNTQRQIIKSVMVSRGSVNRTVMESREIFHQAIKHMASALIVVHNHPSGSPIASDEDIRGTKLLIKASRFLNIELFDHLVIGKGCYTSLRGEKPDLFNDDEVFKEDWMQ